MRAVVYIVCVMLFVSGCQDRPLGECQDIGRRPAIWPDYTDVTLPPNIAPINFVLDEVAKEYYVRISSSNGRAIELLTRSNTVRIPIRPWRRLLAANRGLKLDIEVFAKGHDGKWGRFWPITCRIAAQSVDRYLVYRLIRPLFIYVGRMGIYQRDLSSFDQRPILLNSATGGNCINCHAFCGYDPNRFILHMRAGPIGTYMLLGHDGKIEKVDTRTSFNHPTSYRSWHPNGWLIAFAFNTVRQVFHAVGQTRDVYDRASDLLLYDLRDMTISTCAAISSPDRMETYPEWSPEGNYLYFCSGPSLADVNGYQQPHKAMRYDIMRIQYDPDTGKWGQVEPVLLASQMGLSAAHPKVSPDGRYLLFCISEYTYFPLYRPESDLYILDINAGQFRKAESINSPAAEGYHCWSSNGRWVVFSSKRLDGQSTHLFLSYFDQEGRFHKPFLLPQKDPADERDRIVVYNLPEFLAAPIRFRPQAMVRAAWSRSITKTQLDPNLVQQVPQRGEDLPYMTVGPGR